MEQQAQKLSCTAVVFPHCLYFYIITVRVVSSSVSFSCFQSQFLLQYNFTNYPCPHNWECLHVLFSQRKIAELQGEIIFAFTEECRICSLKFFFLNQITLSLDTDMTFPLCSWPYKRRNSVCVKVHSIQFQCVSLSSSDSDVHIFWCTVTISVSLYHVLLSNNLWTILTSRSVPHLH